MKTERTLLILIPIYLIFSFVRRLSFPETESATRTVNVLAIVTQLGMVAGIIGMTFRRLNAESRPLEAVGLWMVLPGLGLVAGLGLLSLTLTGGHRAELPSRAGQSETTARETTSDAAWDEVAKLDARAEALEADVTDAFTAMARTSWGHGLAAGLTTLRNSDRAELERFVAKEQAVVESLERMHQFLNDPAVVADYAARPFTEAQAGSSGRKRSGIDPRAWPLLRRMYVASHEANKIALANWDEWRSAGPITSEAEAKPWQKEYARLQREIDSAKEEVAALAEPAPSPPIPAQPTPEPHVREQARKETELRAFHAAHRSLWDKLQDTRWAKAGMKDPRDGNLFTFATVTPGAIPHLRKLNRQDLAEFRDAQRAVLESHERALALFQEAQTKGLDPFHVGFDLGGAYRKLESWRAAQKVFSIAHAQSGLIEENWQDWQRNGLGAKAAKPKPWQRKAAQLTTEFVAAFNAWEASR